MQAVSTRQRATGQVTAQRWMKLAGRDLAVANQIFDTYPDSAAFHFQEAAGMYLKAFLASHLVPLKRSDSISTLVNHCSKIDAEFNSLSKAADLDLIMDFATKYRYPNDEDQEFPARAELMQARVFCEQARDLVGSRLQHFEINADMPLAIRLAAFKPEVHGGEFPGNE